MSTVQPKITPNVTIQTTSQANTWQSILAAILAAFHAAAPIIIHIVPPPVAVGLEIGDALAPIVVQTVVTATTPQSQP